MQIKKQKEIEMTISKFSQLVARNEALKKQVNIAQIKEILKVINKITEGVFYKIIRAL